MIIIRLGDIVPADIKILREGDNTDQAHETPLQVDQAALTVSAEHSAERGAEGERAAQRKAWCSGRRSRQRVRQRSALKVAWPALAAGPAAAAGWAAASLPRLPLT